MTHRMTIAGVTRDLPICKVTDDLYIGAFIMFGDAELTVCCAQELLKLAKEIADANAEGEKLGLTADELAFYDALTKPQAIKDFYEHDELIAITKELTDLLRKNRTIDWQKKESARAGMRRLVKRLLKKHKYPPEGMDDAVQTVMSQCEMWTDNVMTV